MSDEALVVEERPFDEKDWSSWKLTKDTLPPKFIDQETWWTPKLRLAVAYKDSAYLHFLLNADTGLFGFRPGNPWRLYPRQWIERFVVIQDKRSGKLVPFTLNEAQRLLLAQVLRMLRAGEPVSIAILKARQQGISTEIAAILLWLSVTHPHTRGLLMGHKKDSASVIKGRVATMLKEMRRKDGRHWYLHLETDNRKQIELGQPLFSVIIVDSAEAPDYRGDTIRFFHAIEPADWPNAKDKANAVMQLVPQAAWTFRFIEGTAKGDTGWFAETWKTAWRRQRDGVDSGGMVSMFFPWFIHAGYRWSSVFGRPLSAKDEQEIMSTLSEEEEKLLRQCYLRRGVGFVHVDADQLAWRRWCIRENSQNSVENFHQEYPAYPEEAFLSTGSKLFSSVAIARQRETFATEPSWRGDTFDPEGERRMMLSLADIEQLEAEA